MTDKLVRFNEHNPVGKVDRENGIIYGVSVITGNREATGHEMWVDETMVSQVVDFGNENKQGLKARFDHPNPCAGSMGTVVGRFKNFTKDGIQARADLHLLESAADSPNGDYRTYILNLAAEDPEAFATSIVFRQGEAYEPQHEDFSDKDPEDPFFYPHARIKALTHCDVVDEGAANEGLFGRPDYLAEQAEKFLSNPQIESILIPLLNKRIEQTIKEMSDKNENKVTLFDRLKTWFTAEDAPKTDEEIAEQFSAIAEDVKELSAANEDLTTQLSAKETELSELQDQIEAGKLALQAAQEESEALQVKLAEAGAEFPAAGEADTQDITPEPPERAAFNAKVAAISAKVEYIEKRKRGEL